MDRLVQFEHPQWEDGLQAAAYWRRAREAFHAAASMTDPEANAAMKTISLMYAAMALSATGREAKLVTPQSIRWDA
jgi:hypothetical protein